MRRQRILSLSFVALLAATVLPSAAAEAQQARFQGSWAFDRQQSDDINAKINQSISRMNVVVRQIARPRLRSTNTAYPRLTFGGTANSVTVDMQGRPSVTTPIVASNEQGVLWHRETGRTCQRMAGDCVRVSGRWVNGALEQTFQAEDGRRVNLFTLSSDGGTMTMNVTITSPKLPNPLTYRLVYDKQ